MSMMMSSYGLSEKTTLSLKDPRTFSGSDGGGGGNHHHLMHTSFLDDKSSSSFQIKREPKSEIIHSGHFMVSQIDDQQDEVNEDVGGDGSFKDIETSDDIDSMQTSEPISEISNNPSLPTGGSPKKIYDTDLSDLFKSLKLCYSNCSLTSPKWKSFKGLALKLKDKIRLNNIIWRAWHIQYIIGRDPYVCRFSSPVDCDVHKNSAESVILEGKYWKRRQTAVIAEYKKWRSYYKIKRKARPSRHSFSGYHDGPWNEFTLNPELHSLGVDDDFTMDFNDNSLFYSLVPSNFDFPNPREIARSGMGADFIQPGLTQLQPSLEDFSEPLSDILGSRFHVLPPLLEETTSENNKDAYKVGERFPRFGRSPTPTSTYNTSITWMSNVSNSSSRIETSNYASDPATGSNMTTETMGFSQRPIASMVASLDQPMTQPLDQALSQEMSTINEMNAASSNSMNMASMSSMESSNMQVQISPMNQASFAHQTSSEPLKSSEAQQSQSDFDCMMDINPMPSQNGASSYDPSLVKQDPCSMSTETSDPNTSANPNNQLASSPHGQFVHFPKMYQRPPKSRSRSTSTPHASAKSPMQQQQQQQQQQQSPQQTHTIAHTSVPVPVNNVSSSKNTMERSNSLPVYAHRRNAIGPAVNAQILQQSQQNLASLRCAFPSDSFNSTAAFTSTNTNNNSNNSPSSSHIVNPYTSKRVTSAFGSEQQTSLIAQLLSSNTIPSISHSGNTNTSTNVGMSSSGGGGIGMKSASLTSLNTFEKNSESSGQTYKFHTPPISTTTNMSLGFNMDNRILSNSGSASTLQQQQQQARLSSNSVTASILLDGSPKRLSLDMSTNQQSQLFSNSKPIRKISSPVSPSILGSPFSPSKDSNLDTPVSSPLGPPASLPPKTFKIKSDPDKINYKEHRRVCHINAEQKRRCNIKNGFDILRTLLPSISQNANTKISKAAILQKGAEHIRQLKLERQQYQEESSNLRGQIENLNHAIGVFHSQLPATGAPISCQRASQMREKFDQYVRDRTSRNWKFYIFGLIMEALLESYMTAVTTNDFDDMCRSVLRWMEQNCSLVTLRREALHALRNLSTTTNILSHPDKLSEEILDIVCKKSPRLNN